MFSPLPFPLKHTHSFFLFLCLFLSLCLSVYLSLSLSLSLSLTHTHTHILNGEGCHHILSIPHNNYLPSPLARQPRAGSSLPQKLLFIPVSGLLLLVPFPYSFAVWIHAFHITNFWFSSPSFFPYGLAKRIHEQLLRIKIHIISPSWSTPYIRLIFCLPVPRFSLWPGQEYTRTITAY